MAANLRLPRNQWNKVMNFHSVFKKAEEKPVFPLYHIYQRLDGAMHQGQDMCSLKSWEKKKHYKNIGI